MNTMNVRNKIWDKSEWTNELKLKKEKGKRCTKE